jgi:allantoinase
VPVFDVVLRSRRVVTPAGEGPATVCVRGETIAEVLPYDREPAAARVLDLGDDALLPGLVDTHVHVNEPGRTAWEGFESATRAAAAGGVTTILDMPLNSIPPTVSAAALATKRAAAEGRCAVDVGFWGGAVPANSGRGRDGALRALHDAGVFGFKCFRLDSGVPEFPPLDRAGIAAALAALAPLGALLIEHAELPEPIDAAPAPRGGSYAGFLGSRPPAAEDGAVAELVGLVREAALRAGGGPRAAPRAHVVHLSSAGALASIREAKAAGLAVTAETCPHYLCLSAEEVPDGATWFKCCPPIREAANAEPLWDALADGTIDCVVSDHSPCPPAMKALDSGDFGAAWGGVASLQLGLPVVWTEARRRGHTLADVARWMAAGPARLAGLARKGAIVPGNDADFAVVDPDAAFTVDPATLRHRHPLTPYAGRRLTGVVRSTWLRGAPVGGAPVGGAPRGRLLRRDGD